MVLLKGYAADLIRVSLSVSFDADLRHMGNMYDGLACGLRSRAVASRFCEHNICDSCKFWTVAC